MADIIAKLTEWRDAPNVRKEVRDLAREAADEIERLQAENERLRAALEEIALPRRRREITSNPNYQREIAERALSRADEQEAG